MIKLINVPSFYASLFAVIDFCKENEGKEIDIIVPDKLSLFIEKYLFEKMNIKASFNIHINTLNRYSKKNCEIDSNKQISKTASIICINKILNEHMNEFKVMNNKSYSFSYAENIYDTIMQFKASSIGYEEMMNFSSDNIELENKIHDLALMFMYYENEKAGLLDSSDEFVMSVLTVAENKEGRKIIFVGFDDFTAIQYAIIERLALVTEVFVLNYKSQGSNKRIFNHEIYDQLNNIAHINNIGFEQTDIECNCSMLKTFLHKNLFGISNDFYTLDKETIKLMSGNSISDEIEFVAREIRSRIISNHEFKEFGVAVFNLQNNEDKIKEIFAKYELNYYIDTQIPIINSILYRFVLSVLRFNLEGYTTYHLIDIISSPFFNIDNNEKRKLIDKLLTIDYQGKNVLSLDFDEKLKDIVDKTKEFVDNFVLNKSDKVSDFISILTQADKLINFDEILNQLKDNANLNEQILIKKSKETLFEILSDINRFYSSADLKTVLDILVRLGSIVMIKNLPAGIDAVKVVDADNTMEIFDKFYIIGCDNINAPKTKNDCGIIVDKEIEKLNFSHKLAPTIAHINRLNKLRLYNLALSFEKDLTITYSGTKSELISDLMKKIVVGESFIDTVPISAVLHNNIAVSKTDYVEKLYHAKISENNEKIELIKNKNFEQISDENLNIYDEMNSVSASYLESYFTCPFYSFLNNILKIKPREKLEIQSFDIGSILHNIIDVYYKKHKQVGDIYTFVKDEIFNYINKDERLKFNVDSPIISNLIEETMRVIEGLNYIDENSNFIPKYFEKEFKSDSALNLRNIKLKGKIDRVDEVDNTFRIIDYKSGRADASLKELFYGKKLQLFLYSCAMEEMENKKVVGCFYLPLHNKYLSEEENSYALKGFFFNDEFVVKNMDNRLVPGMKSDIVNIKMSKNGLANKTIGNKELDYQDFERLKKYSKELSENAIDEIKSGYIKPCPIDIGKVCDFCPYAHVCMKASNDIKYRAPQVVNLESFKRGEE